jgi:phosphinothricin acetyltransferase
MVQIRAAADADFGDITKIYGQHVLHGLASFEVDPPSQDEMRERWKGLLERGLPYLVADVEDRIAGYAYATPYRHRRAYRHSVENSVYADPEMTGRGVGRALLSRLISDCEVLGLRQMVAIIGDSGNAASIGLHSALGFEHTGTLRGVGFKAGRWVDTVIMQRTLGDGETSLPVGAGGR